jgi:hypothetical protein
MRICLSLAAVPLLVGVVAGQATTTNEFEIYPDSTDAVSRSALPGSAIGDVLIEVRGTSWNAFGVGGFGQDAFGNVGDDNSFSPAMGGSGAGTVAGFTNQIQDQNGSTSESFDFVVVVEDGANPRQPAPAPIGNPFGPEVLLRTSALTTTPGQPSAPIVWVTNALLATPQDVLPTVATWYYGCGLSSNALWANDGVSLPMASYNGLGSPFPNEGDNPYEPSAGGGGGPSNITWARNVTAGGPVIQSGDPRTQRVGIRTFAPIGNWGAIITPAAVLGMGAAPNPNFGVAGIYPDAAGVGNAARVANYGGPPVNYPGRGGVGDGLAVRMRAVQSIGVSGSVYLLTGTIGLVTPPTYLNNPGFLGPVTIDLLVTISLPVKFSTGGGPFPATGEHVDTFAANGALAAFAGAGVLSVQTLMLDSIGRVHLSNSMKTNF